MQCAETRSATCVATRLLCARLKPLIVFVHDAGDGVSIHSLCHVIAEREWFILSLSLVFITFHALTLKPR